MNHRAVIAICAVASLLSSGAGFAQAQQQRQGETSGPAAGKPVEPSTVIQKRNEGRSGIEDEDTRPAAGMPGVEGMPGTQSGPALEDEDEPED